MIPEMKLSESTRRWPDSALAVAWLGGWLVGWPALGAITLPTPSENGAARAPGLLVPQPRVAEAVPSPNAPGQPATPEATVRPLTLTVELRDGSRLLGSPTLTNLQMRASFGTVGLDLNLVQTIQFAEDKETATIALQNGDKMTGALKLEALELKTSFGEVRLPLPVIRRVSISPRGKSRQGLVLHYTFDQEDNTTVRDQSGLGHDGKLAGARWTPNGKFGGGCALANQTATVAVGNPEALRLQTFTLALWVRRANENSTSGAGYCAFLAIHNNRGYSLGLEPDGRLFFVNQAATATAPERQAVQSRVANLEFHHLAVVCADKKAILYLDGTSCGDVEVSEAFQFGGELHLGGVGNGVGYGFLGTLDEVMMFNRALGEPEIKQLVDSVQ
jgi:hypothetical protein